MEAHAIDRHATFTHLAAPQMLSGVVVRGTGTQSKELQCPTATVTIDASSRSMLRALEPGVYFGHAVFLQISTIPYAMLMNVNDPADEDGEKSIDVHLFHEFPKHFYGKKVGIVPMDYLRPHVVYAGLDAHRQAIQADIRFAKLHIKSEHLETSGWEEEELGLCECRKTTE